MKAEPQCEHQIVKEREKLALSVVWARVTVTPVHSAGASYSSSTHSTHATTLTSLQHVQPT